MIENTELFAYIEQLTIPQRDALVAALSSDNRCGPEYKGPHIDRSLSAKLTPAHIVGGAYLSPLGKRMAELIRDTETLDL